MELLMTTDTTSLDYWFNWRVLLSMVWVLGSMVIALFLIWKYERLDSRESNSEGLQQQGSWNLLYYESWKPCFKELHPGFLAIFRVIAFCLLLVALSFDIAVHGGALFYYYTQWTFCLVTIYFGFGAVLSIHGCYLHYKLKTGSHCPESEDMEQGLYVPLAHERNAYAGKSPESLNYGQKYFTSEGSKIWGFLFHVLFQMTGGAVALTDGVYWSVIFPFLTIRDYELSFLTVIAHSLNAVLLVGDVALNSLKFPWYRISYFILLTGIYVIFEWVVHACIRIWWPYPFLDLSSAIAPFWYLLVALLHPVSYGICALIVKVKEFLWRRLFPHSYECPT